MHFLPDVYVTCDVCKGKRYNRETLEVRSSDKSIADVLDMTVEEAARALQGRAVDPRQDGDARIASASATSTSASRRRRSRAARRSASSSSKELSKRATGRTLYILDEPTTGLHFHDVAKLLEVLHELVEQGNTVVVIEHNLEVIKTADWVIDLGPEGGDGGGEIVAAGHARGHRGERSELYRPLPARGAAAPAVTCAEGWRRRSRSPLPLGELARRRVRPIRSADRLP